MAASALAWLLFLFFLLPCFSNSCPLSLPCNPSIQIKPPFYFQPDNTNDSPCQGPDGHIGIGCNGDNHTILFLFESRKYSLESISYNTSIVRVRDDNLTHYLNQSGCDNLYFNFSTPVKNFFDPLIYNPDSFGTGLSSVRCNPPNQIQKSPPELLGTGYNLSNNSSLDENFKPPPNCSRIDNDSDAYFELILLFENESAELSLVAAAYSRDFVAQPGCPANSIEDKGKKVGAKKKDVLIIGSSIIGLQEGKDVPINGKKVGAKKKGVLIIGTVAGCLAFIVIVTGLVLFEKLQNYKSCILSSKYGPQGNIETLLEKYGSIAPKIYKYGEVKKIANSFQDILGKGGFGTVYKGRLPDGRLVAVKILHHSSIHGEEFLNEVLSISRTSHVNVVSLLGFCIKGSKHALIYQYMPNGSLDNYIYSENPKSVLGWKKLYEIAIGIARGLEYLHRGCNTRIVHFDIKPQNILLDKDFNPKIADFGLAKLCPPKESILSMADMRGTIGYIAPEVFSRAFGVVSAKSDVYSYGMMMLEMVGGRRNAKPSVENVSQVFFPHWLHDRLAEGHQIQAHDVSIQNEEIAKKMAIVGLWCTQTVPANRPSMSRVVEMLEKSLTELEMPPKPYLSSPPHFTLLSADTSST